MDEKDLLQEGTQAADGLEATSASDAAPAEPAPSLSTPVAPTAEEKADAGIVEPAGEPEGPSALTEDDLFQAAQPDENPSHIEDHADAVDHPAQAAPETPAAPQERMFTQSQVNEMMGECRMSTRERTFRYIYDRYGVSGDKELDDLVGNAQRYETLSDQYKADKASWDGERKTFSDQSKEREAALNGLKEQIALMQSGVDASKYDDVKAILGYKGLEISADNIQAELAGHPEWKATQPAAAPNPNFMKKPEPQSKLSILGNEPKAGPSPEEEEEAMALRYFK